MGEKWLRKLSGERSGRRIEGGGREWRVECMANKLIYEKQTNQSHILR